MCFGGCDVVGEGVRVLHSVSYSLKEVGTGVRVEAKCVTEGYKGCLSVGTCVMSYLVKFGVHAGYVEV